MRKTDSCTELSLGQQSRWQAFLGSQNQGAVYFQFLALAKVLFPATKSVFMLPKGIALEKNKTSVLMPGPEVHWAEGSGAGRAWPDLGACLGEVQYLTFALPGVRSENSKSSL